MQRIAILFDIDELGGGFYGPAAWNILLNCVDPMYLMESLLLQGDTDERIPGHNRPYCFAIAIDYRTSEQEFYIVNTLSTSNASGLMPTNRRFAKGTFALEQALIPVARVDHEARFVLLDHGYLWVLKTADAASWRHKIDDRCLHKFIAEFLAPYEHGDEAYYTREEKFLYARTLRETGGTASLHAIEAALQKENDITVRQTYEEAIAGLGSIKEGTDALQIKNCAICGTVVESNLIICPKCGRGVFETAKKYQQPRVHKKRQIITKALIYSPCNKCGRIGWVKPDRSELVAGDGYLLRDGAILVCYNCGNEAEFWFKKDFGEPDTGTHE